MNLTHPLLNTDSYKMSHRKMFIPGTTLNYSGLTPRSNKYLKQAFPSIPDSVVVFGMQMAIEQIVSDWNTMFFNVPYQQTFTFVYPIINKHLGMGIEEFNSMFQPLHRLGYLPVEIRIIEEGSIVPLNIPILTIVNTDDRFFWLTNFLEPVLINSIFKPVTAATIGKELATIRKTAFDATVVDNEGIDYAYHDFSGRGHHGTAAAVQACLAYLLYTKGTDTLAALQAAKWYYNGDDVAHSIDATEHSVTSQGIYYYSTFYNDAYIENLSDEFLSLKYKMDLNHILKVKELVLNYVTLDPTTDPLGIGELINLYRLLTIVCPTGIMAYVSDTFNMDRLVNLIVVILKDVIKNRDGKLVLRPDSGDPVENICGKRNLVPKINEDLYKTLQSKGTDYHFVYKGYDYLINNRLPEITDGYIPIALLVTQGVLTVGSETGYPTTKELCNVVYEDGIVDSLFNTFGGTVNAKGFKQLASCIGMVYGDGMNFERISSMYSNLEEKGYAANNICLAAGAYLLSNMITRDSLGFAIKSSNTIVDGTEVPVNKAPITDQGKASPKGYLYVDPVSYKMESEVTWEKAQTGALKPLFRNGEYNFAIFKTLDQLREVLNA